MVKVNGEYLDRAQFGYFLEYLMKKVKEMKEEKENK